MAKKQRRSFGRKLNQANKSLFVGREAQLKLFNDNLGHVALLQGKAKKAMECYKISILLWEDKAAFPKGMQQDYLDLKMEASGISKTAYADIVEELRQFSEA